MNIALELMNGTEETNAALREQAEEDELRFEQKRMLDMAAVSVPEASIRAAPIGLKAATAPVPAAATSPGPNADDTSDQKHT